MRRRVLVHPNRLPGLADALDSVDSIDELILADSDEEVHAELQGEPTILVTYTWEDAFHTPSLVWVAGLGAGIEQYPIKGFRRAGTILTSAVGIHTVPVRDHVFALLLGLMRQIPACVRDQDRRVWRRHDAQDLAGQTMAIAGLGSIGESVAVVARAFGMRVLGVKRSPDGYGGAAHGVYGPDSILDVCREADVLVVSVPGGASTRNLIGPAELTALGEGWLINVARGSAVDESALIAALTEGDLHGAGIDVFEEEPLPAASPLWGMKNAILTPHMGATSGRAGERWAQLFQENLMALDDQRPWRNRVT